MWTHSRSSCTRNAKPIFSLVRLFRLRLRLVLQNFAFARKICFVELSIELNIPKVTKVRFLCEQQTERNAKDFCGKQSSWQADLNFFCDLRHLYWKIKLNMKEKNFNISVCLLAGKFWPIRLSTENININGRGKRLKEYEYFNFSKIIVSVWEETETKTEM